MCSTTIAKASTINIDWKREDIFQIPYGLQLTINKLKAKSVIGVNMNTKTYYISKSLGAFRKIGINEGIIERAIKGKYDKYNMYWFYICDVDIDKLKDQGFIEVYKI